MNVEVRGPTVGIHRSPWAADDRWSGMIRPERTGSRQRTRSGFVMLLATLAAISAAGVGATVPASLRAAEAGSTTDADLVLVMGAGGTEGYAAEFSRWGARWLQAAQRGRTAAIVLGPSPAGTGRSDHPKGGNLRPSVSEPTSAPPAETRSSDASSRAASPHGSGTSPTVASGLTEHWQAILKKLPDDRTRLQTVLTHLAEAALDQPASETAALNPPDRRAADSSPSLVAGAPETASDAALEAAATRRAAVRQRPLWIVLIGHGTFDRRSAKFNLVGPDLSASDLKAWLTNCSRPLALIDCSAASGPFLQTLSGPGRVVITATKSGSEQNFAQFGDALSRSIADPQADLDKDQQVSLWEAFLAAARDTAAFYQQEGRLQTEHALLDDDGDGVGVRAEDFHGLRLKASKFAAATTDGLRAHQWHLVPSPQTLALSPANRERCALIERELQSLRERRASLSEEDYLAAIEPWLVELSRLMTATPKSGLTPEAR